MRPLEATYLAWLDLRAYGVDDPAAPALAHGVRWRPGGDYQPGLPGHVRLNIATSARGSADGRAPRRGGCTPHSLRVCA